MNQNHYRRLLVMTVLSFISMYTLTYVMVATLDHVYININKFYMAGLMTAPMIVIELLLMGAMYPNKKLNAALMGGSIVIGLVLLLFVRQQTLIGDQQFLRSMIPHHAGAILMCEQASVKDPELVELCQSIIASQQEEIDIMKAKLADLNE